MKLKCWHAIFVLVLSGCASSNALREHEVSADLPRAQGLGAFASSCIFLCFPTAHFVHGDDAIDANAAHAPMRSKLTEEHDKSSGAHITKKPKPPPKGTKP